MLLFGFKHHKTLSTVSFYKTQCAGLISFMQIKPCLISKEIALRNLLHSKQIFIKFYKNLISKSINAAEELFYQKEKRKSFPVFKYLVLEISFGVHNFIKKKINRTLNIVGIWIKGIYKIILIYLFPTNI